MVFLVRAAVYGVVLLLAVVVLVARENRESSAANAGRPPGKELALETSQQAGGGAAVVDKGRVTGIHMVWRLSCTNGSRWGAPLQDAWREPADRFDREGRNFIVRDQWSYPPKGGWFPDAHVFVNGTTAPDGRSASGHATALVQWKSTADGHVGGVCTSGDVAWRTAAG